MEVSLIDLNQGKSGKSLNSRYVNPDNDPRGPYCAVDLTAPGSRPNLIYMWKEILPPKGRHWQVDQSTALSLDAEGQIIWPSRGGRPRRKRYLAELEGHTEEPVEKYVARGEILLRTALRALAEDIARIPETLKSVEWRILERVLQEVLEGLGFETTLTRPGRDGGFDLEVRCDEDGKLATYLIEVKHWAKPSKPGRAIVSRFVDVVVKRSADRGLILSSSGFTQDVLHGYSEIERQRVKLGDGEKIIGLCQSYIKSKKGFWIERSKLPEVLFDSTL